jgi:ATP phosphoribosyltransferase
LTRVALPTGELRGPVRELLARAGVVTPGYEPESRIYRPTSLEGGLTFRIFRERDIPIQIALGNYDLGICSLAWLQELHARHPQDDVVILGGLDLPAQPLVLSTSVDGMPGDNPITIVSEFPNLSERVAGVLRLRSFRVLQVWGGAEAYPPEDASFVVGLGNPDPATLRNIQTISKGQTVLIASAQGLASGAAAGLVARLPLRAVSERLDLPRSLPAGRTRPPERPPVRLAIPDGHQQRHAYASLRDAGISFDGYGEAQAVRRPDSNIAGLGLKVVRPQDMPQLVALGLFDLALTGRDWLADHLSRFPESPVEMAVDLGRSRYSLAAVVDGGFPADTLEDAVAIWRRLDRPLRIASEYMALADAFGRRHHLRDYRVIPIAGASEGFVPEDADVLIEGSETGSTIRANDLKVLDWIFESTNCLVRTTRPLPAEAALIAGGFVERMRGGVHVAG